MTAHATDAARLFRARFLALAKRRRAAPGRGSSPSLLAARTCRMRWPDLTEALRELPWAVCGAVATRLYMPERATADLDVVIFVGDRASVHQRLAANGCTLVGPLSIGGSTWRAPDGMEIDVIERDDPWVSEALAQAYANRDLQGLPILPLPYLVLMKLQASRAQDLADLTRMLGAADAAAVDDVRRIVRMHAPADAQDFDSLIELGRLELGEGPT